MSLKHKVIVREVHEVMVELILVQELMELMPGINISSISSLTDKANRLTQNLDVVSLAAEHQMGEGSNDQGGIWVWN